MLRKILITLAIAAVTLTSTGCSTLLADTLIAVPLEITKGTVGLTFYTLGGTIDLVEKADKASHHKAKRQAELQVLQAKAMAAVQALDQIP